MTKGGLDDNLSQRPRGKSFEAELRADIRQALLENSVVRNTACAEHAVKKRPDFTEEIDLLVRFDSLLLVGEVKCFLFPTDARERYNFLKNLKAACAQASRKARKIAGRSDISARALGISEAVAQQLRVLPIMVVNQGFGVSLMVDDCVVVDAKFLKLYLSTGTYVSEDGANHVAGGWAEATRSLYRSASEAIANFESAMRRPSPLYRFRKLLRWSSFTFPTSSKDPLLIVQTVVGELSGETQARYELLSTLAAN